ncbi:MAG: helix-turn-helix domain-containing protein [Bifidobacteriaceae bacterium]|nr:helix-turn-helix domain-containing protein [Bifidobacteriaceae bacterium]
MQTVPISRIKTGSPYLTSGDGTAIPLSEEDLQRVIRAISSPQRSTSDLGDFATTVSDSAQELITTGAAARILGVSAKTVSRLLDSGAMPFVRYGTSGRRKVKRSDVMAYKKRSERNLHKGVQEIHQFADTAASADEDEKLHTYLAHFK